MKMIFMMCIVPEAMAKASGHSVHAYIYPEENDDATPRDSIACIQMIRAICDPQGGGEDSEFASYIHEGAVPEGAKRVWWFAIDLKHTPFGIRFSKSYGAGGDAWDGHCAAIGRDLMDYVWSRCAPVNAETKRNRVKNIRVRMVVR